MNKAHLNLLVDTNVWLDYLLGRDNVDKAIAFLDKAIDGEDVVAIAPSIMKDIFFLIGISLKNTYVLDTNNRVPKSSAKAIREIAWSSLAIVQSKCVMLNQGFQEHLMAMTFKNNHSDYEDDLLLATAKEAHIDYIVTNDRGLLKNKIVPAITPEEYVEL